MKVLLVCHSFAPGRGSEPGFSWNWATHLSKYHEIWVLAHPEFRAEVDAHLARNPNPRLHLKWLKATAWDPSQGQDGVAWHYLRWVKHAQRVGRAMHAEVGFDLIHHISLATVSAPPDWWKLEIPFVWGPLGGAQTCPPALRTLFGGRQVGEWLRPARLSLMRWYPPFRAAVTKSAAVLAVNHETRNFLQSAGGHEVPLFWDSGVADDALPPPPEPRPQPATIRVLWASRFQKRKALPLALEALALLGDRIPIKLVVAGEGREGERWRARTAAMGLQDRVEFLGGLPSVRMQEEFRRADIFLFTSVRDTFGTVVLEAMTQGVPVIALDIHGVGARMPDDAGIKVAVTSRAATAAAIAAALERLAGDAPLRHAMGTAGWRYASTQLWSERAAQMSALYSRVVTSPHTSDPVTRAPQQGVVVQP